MGELLSGAEGQFRGQGMGTPGTGPAGGVRGPVPGAPLSVEDALDGDLDAYLDRALFVRPSEDSAARAAESEPGTEAAGSMRALLDLADEESSWLEMLPPPCSVTPPAEPEAPAVEIPEWMRMSPGAKVTTPFAAMLSPVDPDAVAAHGDAAHAATDAAGLPTTPWSVPTSAQQAGAPAYPGTLLPGLAPMPPNAAIPGTPWAPQHAVPMGHVPQQWGMPLPAHAEPKRIVGMKPGAFLGAAAVGALAAGLLVVAGLHFREHMSGAHDVTGTQGSFASPSATGLYPTTGTQAAGGTAQAPGVAGQPGMPLTSSMAGTAQAGVPGAVGTSQDGITGTAAGAQPGVAGTQPGVAGTVAGTQAGVAGAQPGIAGTVATAQNVPAGTQPVTETSGAQQAAASVSGTVLSTAQGDVQGAANGLRAQPSSGLKNGPAVGGTPLTSGETGTVALQMPSARKPPAKTVVAARPADDAEEAAEAAPSELNFAESESSGADEESTPSEDAEAEEQPQSELDEDFARELGFTEDAEAKAAAPQVPERTVYIPPAPDAKEHLTPDDVKAVVVTNQPAITACIRQHAQGTPVEKGGRFMVRWSVLPSGDTSGVSMDTDALKATPLAHCIEDVVRRWKFPVHQVRMEEPIRFPFVF